MNKYEKALKLLLDGRVKHLHGTTYLVQGDHGEYRVTLDAVKGKPICDCEYWALHQGICSHIIAVTILHTFAYSRREHERIKDTA